MDMHCPNAVKSGTRHPHIKLSVVYEFRGSGSSVILDEWNVESVESSGWIQGLINYKIQINTSLNLSCLAKER